MCILSFPEWFCVKSFLPQYKTGTVHTVKILEYLFTETLGPVAGRGRSPPRGLGGRGSGPSANPACGFEGSGWAWGLWRAPRLSKHLRGRLPGRPPRAGQAGARTALKTEPSRRAASSGELPGDRSSRGGRLLPDARAPPGPEPANPRQPGARRGLVPGQAPRYSPGPQREGRGRQCRRPSAPGPRGLRVRPGQQASRRWRRGPQGPHCRMKPGW